MNNSDRAECFRRLKNEVRSKVSESLGISKELKDWSVNDIRDFQDDLMRKCKSSVSEKWVYTHLKKDNKTLPRIDVLNVLSDYCGYSNWDEFCSKNQIEIKRWKPLKLLWPAIIIAIATLIFWFANKPEEVMIQFKDAYTNQTIDPSEIKVKMNPKNMKYSIGKNVLTIAVNRDDSISVDGNYYKPNQYFINSNQLDDTLILRLFPDDYALMLNYFSRTTIEDWEHRQNQLNSVIHEEARIFQVHPKYDGIEMLNKREFINRLTLPINSLKNLEILNIEYRDNKIFRLRFLQNID